MLPAVDAPEPSTLLDVLRRRFPAASTTTLRQMLRHDRVRVNGVPERVAKRPITETDRVEVVGRSERPLDPRVRILFEDRDLIVVDKAAGLLTVPSPVVLHETAESFLNVYAGARPPSPRCRFASERVRSHRHSRYKDTSSIKTHSPASESKMTSTLTVLPPTLRVTEVWHSAHVDVGAAHACELTLSAMPSNESNFSEALFGAEASVVFKKTLANQLAPASNGS